MEADMHNEKARGKAKAPAKKRPRHYSYDESVNEPAKLLEQEAVEIEEEIPSEDSESIEGVEPEDRTTAEVEE
jgi:hypothetical protein